MLTRPSITLNRAKRTQPDLLYTEQAVIVVVNLGWVF